MKSRAILLLLGLMLSGGFIFGQTPKNTTKKDSIPPPTQPQEPSQPHSKIFFSFGKSWQISKEAYKKQLEAMGLSEKELDKKMQEFEKQKAALMEKIKVQMKTVEKQLQLSEIQRKISDKQIEKVTKQLNSVEFQKKMAEVQRKVAEVQRKLAEKQVKMAEEWRSSVNNLLDEDVTMSGENSKTKSIKINVTKSNTLFFNIGSTINSGNVFIQIINPKGHKEGELSLEYRKKSTSKKTTKFPGNISGSLNKIINAPETGEWVVKIKQKKSKGHIHVSVAQYTKPTN